METEPRREFATFDDTYFLIFPKPKPTRASNTWHEKFPPRTKEGRKEPPATQPSQAKPKQGQGKARQGKARRGEARELSRLGLARLTSEFPSCRPARRSRSAPRSPGAASPPRPWASGCCRCTYLRFRDRRRINSKWEKRRSDWSAPSPIIVERTSQKNQTRPSKRTRECQICDCT